MKKNLIIIVNFVIITTCVLSNPCFASPQCGGFTCGDFTGDHCIISPQYLESYGWTRGCSPSSAAMALSYGENRFLNYGNLILWYQDQYEPILENYYDCETWPELCIHNVPQLINTLATRMSTNSSGNTSPGNIHLGIMYAANNVAGYNYNSRQVGSGILGEGWDWCWGLITQEIDNSRPFVWSSTKLDWIIFPSGHSMAAIGYTDDKKVIVRDPNYAAYPEITGSPVECRWRYNYYEYDDVGAWGTQVDTIERSGGYTADVKLVSPIGGEQYYSGQTVQISWNHYGTTSIVKVKLLYSDDAGNTWYWITPSSYYPSSPGSNLYPWSAPSNPGTAYRIKIYAYDSNNVQRAGDGSVHDFTVLPTFNISGYVRTSGGAGISGVLMNGLPNSPTTNSSGYYSDTVPYGWSGTVAPSKSGYVFTPSSMAYFNVLTSLSNQDYTGTLQTFTISGYVRTSVGAGISGVLMSGLPNTPSTNANGYYTDTVSYGWSGTVTPSKSGYTFSPPSRSYSNVMSNQTGQDYTGTLQTFTISGYVRTSGGAGISGVLMSGLPNNPATDSSGYYSDSVSYGWSGTVTPNKSGYNFTPSSVPYTNVTSNQTQNYTGTLQTFTISGNVTSGGSPLSGVTMGGLPNNPVTNASGNYTDTVTYGWSGSVTPTKAGYNFTPSSVPYTNVTSNQTQNYTAVLQTFTISGYVRTSGGAGISGVLMSGLPNNPSTDANGYYSDTVSYGWLGTVTPIRNGYTFSPPSRSYSNVVSNQTGQDYTGTLQTFTISGYVRTSGGAGISGVLMSGLPNSPSTDANGYYSDTVSYGWSGTVTPIRNGYTFNPPSRSYSNVTSNQTAQDYTGALNTYVISGYVETSGGAGISGVLMSGLPNSPSTDANGYYSDTVSYGWSGTVTPSKSGYTFSPPSRSYSNVMSNQTGQDYTGINVVQPFSFLDDFSTDKGWNSYEPGGWERGPAVAGGGENGNQDPGADHSPSADNYILGFAIGGDYPNDLVEKTIVSPPVDCIGQSRVFLKFWRYLNVQKNYYDHAKIFVSIDGTNWPLTPLWENPVFDLTDNQWTPVVFDISSIAANQGTVYIKFAMGPTDSSMRFSGWNIDDLEITSDYTGPLALYVPSGDIPNPNIDEILIADGLGIQHFGQIPSDLSDYSLVIVSKNEACDSTTASDIKNFVQNGGGAIIMGGTPKLLAGNTDDLFTISDWFGAGWYGNDCGYATVVIDNLLGTDLKLGDNVDYAVTGNCSADSVYGENPETTVTSIWATQGRTHSFLHSFGKGGVFYYAGDPGYSKDSDPVTVDNGLILYEAGLLWAVNPYLVTLQSPIDGAIFSSCFLNAGYQPTFSWTSYGTFKRFSILFSTSPTNFKTPIVKVNISGAKNGWIPPILTWKTIMRSSNNKGTIRDIYWKVIGRKFDKTSIESEVRSFRIDSPQGVTIQSPNDGDVLSSGTPPTFVFDTNCNKKFRLEISPIADFSKPIKIKGFIYTVKDPNIETTLQKTLSKVQWNAVKKLIGTTTGYFRIKAWDGISRKTVSEVRSFTVQ